MGHTADLSRTVTRRRTRFQAEEAAETVECTCEYVQSCSVGLIADCVAVCCCPCAVVNLLILAFVKVPWTVGRRCMRVWRKERHFVENNRRIGAEGEDVGVNGNLRVERGVEMEFFARGAEDGGREKVCGADFEAERVLMELYQVGHLGFGRVSFTGFNHAKGI